MAVERDALTRVTVDVPLFAGQNSSADARVVEPGALPLVENGRFQTNGQVQKSYGLTSLPNVDIQGNTITQGRQIFEANGALFLFDGNNLYIWNPPHNAWRLLGGANYGQITSSVIVQTRNDVGELASAANGSVVVIAWVELGAVKYAAFCPTTGSYLQAAVTVSNTGRQPNVMAVGSDFVIAYVELSASPGDVILVKIPGATLATAATLSISAALTSKTTYDVCQSGGSLYVVTSEVGSHTNLVVTQVNPSTMAVSSSSHLDSVTWGADSRVWCFALSAGTVVWGNASAWGYTGAGSPQAFPATGYATPGNVRRIQGAGTNTSNVCWAEVSTGTQIFLEQCSFNVVAPSMSTPGIRYFTNPNTYLATRAFVYDGTIYVWALSDFKFQGQLMLLDSHGRAVGRALTNGGAAPNDGVFCALPSVTQSVDVFGATNLYFAVRRRAQLKFDVNGNASTSIGAMLLNLTYKAPMLQGLTVGASTYVSGTAVQLFDSFNLTELGFWFYADTPALANVALAGNLSAGSYTYALGYAWYDNNGKLWRSPIVLVPAGNTQPNGSSGATITCQNGDGVNITNIRYLQGTAKQNAFIEIYRTQANLTQLYKIGEIANVNSPNVLTTSYYDSLADAAITGEVCYTDGSVAPYLAPPGASYMAATPNRVYVLVSETNEIWVSNQTSSTVPAQFVLGQTLGVPSAQAPVCFEIMDGELYIFNRDGSILTTNADLTSLLGTTALQFAPPRQIPVDAGCLAATSILRTENGIYFQSIKGLTLLNRQQNTVFIGEPVKNYNADTILAALSIPSQQQLRFVGPNEVLMFDYVYQRWSIRTGQTPVGACRWRGSFVMLTGDGRAKVETAGVYTDDGSLYTRRLVTPWIKPAGINGYARAWSFAILGEARGPTTLQVRIAYQYDEAFVDTLQIPSTAANPDGIYGSGLGTYGKTLLGVYGGLQANAYQFVGTIPRQKATAFKFEITDIGSGEAPALTMLTLECGVYAGLARLPASKRTG